MDIVTHLALGVCTAEVLLKDKFSKKTLLWGAIAQALPDIDTIPGIFLPADQALLVHRGITHSLPFAIIMALCLAVLIKGVDKRVRQSSAGLFIFFWFQLTLHDLLDVCNTYGTALLEPFSHQRFSVNLLYVADPLFSAGLIVAALLLLFKSRVRPGRQKWAWTAIALSTFYLCFATVNKTIIDKKVEASLTSERIKHFEYFTTPAPFNCLLWYIVADGDSCYYTAYHSVLDRGAEPIIYRRDNKSLGLLKLVPVKSKVQNLATFAGQYYTVTQNHNNIYFNILRFGQVQGWNSIGAPYVLSYPLTGGRSDVSLLQKGRLSGWNGQALKDYTRRIAGK